MYRKTTSQKIKTRARKSLNKNFEKTPKIYVVDTSLIINKFLGKLIKKGLKGKIIIPNAVMAELENQANRGYEEGFLGLEEVANLHKLKNNYKLQIFFEGLRPNEMQIKFAKSGEIDALIREIALKNKAVLLTADLVQAKSAQAYGLEILYMKPYCKQEKKRFFSFLKKFSKLRKKT
jgi:ATPase